MNFPEKKPLIFEFQKQPEGTNTKHSKIKYRFHLTLDLVKRKALSSLTGDWTIKTRQVFT
jgi:hypothetical protein